MRWGYSMHAAEQRWAQINACRAAPTTKWVDHDTYEERYGDCAVGTADPGPQSEWIRSGSGARRRPVPSVTL